MEVLLVIGLFLIVGQSIRTAIIAWMVWHSCKRSDEATLRLMRSWKR